MDSQLKDELCCPICTDLFLSPLRLPCGHSYCRVCLKAMLGSPSPDPRGRLERLVYGGEEEEERVVLSCPECRREYLMNDQGLDRFQADFKLAKLVELFRRLEMTSLTSDSDPEEEPGSQNSSNQPNRDSVLSVESSRSEPRVSVTETQVCEVLSNVPTELCADTLVKQVETGMPEEDEAGFHLSMAGGSSGGACGGAGFPKGSLGGSPEETLGRGADFPKGSYAGSEGALAGGVGCPKGTLTGADSPGRGLPGATTAEPHPSTAGGSPEGACGGSGATPIVTATATFAETVPEFVDNSFANIVNGESGEIEMCKSVETGEFEKCKYYGNCQSVSGRTPQNLQVNRGPSPQLFSGPYDNLGAVASPDSVNVPSRETQTSNLQSERSSRHGSESPKFPSGNYDNVIDQETVSELLASAGEVTNPSFENPQSNFGSNPNPSNGSSLSLTSSNSRSSKSTNGSRDNKGSDKSISGSRDNNSAKGSSKSTNGSRDNNSAKGSSKSTNGSRDKNFAGSSSVAGSRKISSSDSKAGVSDSSDYDGDDMRMASSVVVKRRKKKKKGRVASFFSSLLFSSSSSDENLDSEEERKLEQRKREAKHFLYHTTSSSD